MHFLSIRKYLEFLFQIDNKFQLDLFILFKNFFRNKSLKISFFIYYDALVTKGRIHKSPLSIYGRLNRIVPLS